MPPRLIVRSMSSDISLGSYFDLSFIVSNEIPKFTIKLKKEFLKDSPAKRKSGLPCSPAELAYFTHHTPEISVQLHEFRKCFFNKEYAASYFFHHSLITVDEYNVCLAYFKNLKKTIKKKHAKSMSDPVVLKKIRDSNKRTAKQRGKIISEHWKDPKRRKRYIAALNDTDVKRRRVENFKKYISENHDLYVSHMRNPERLKKISLASKVMWQKSSENKKKLMLPKSGLRNFVVNDVQMNKIESIVALILNELKIPWKYEHVVRCGNDHCFLPDFWLFEHNVVIECFGDYWHANPKFWKSNDIIFKTKTAKMIWEHDQKKIQAYADVLNAKTIILWENEILANVVENKIYEFTKKYEIR